MKKICLLLVLVLTSLVSFGQLATVAGTVTDADSVNWANGTCSLILQVPLNTRVIFNGSNFTPVPFTCSLDANGQYSIASVPRTDFMTPFGMKYALVVKPNASANGNQSSISVAAASVTANVAPSAIRIIAGNSTAGVYAYTDAEVSSSLRGQGYLNVTDASLHIWNGVSYSVPVSTSLFSSNNNWTGTNTFIGTTINQFKIVYGPDPTTFYMTISYSTIQTASNEALNLNGLGGVLIKANNVEVGTAFASGGFYIGQTPVDPGPTLQTQGISTDPVCTGVGNIGKLWFDTTTTTTVFKVCLDVAGATQWVTK